VQLNLTTKDSVDIVGEGSIKAPVSPPSAANAFRFVIRTSLALFTKPRPLRFGAKYHSSNGNDSNSSSSSDSKKRASIDHDASNAQQAYDDLQHALRDALVVDESQSLVLASIGTAYDVNDSQTANVPMVGKFAIDYPFPAVSSPSPLDPTINSSLLRFVFCDQPTNSNASGIFALLRQPYVQLLSWQRGRQTRLVTATDGDMC
jgi:hypothetical protein